MVKKYFLWLLALPLYYFINAFRHEMAHAFAAFLEGALVTKIRFWPDFINLGKLDWSGVTWQGPTSWLTVAMPYLVDLATFVVFFYICMAIPFQTRWIWLNAVIIGLVSPLINSGLNYLFLGKDVRDLLDMLSPTMVSIFFLSIIVFYLIGLFLTFTFSRTVLPSLPEYSPTNSD